MIVLLSGLALAQEHALAVPPTVGPRGVPIPSGPPLRLHVEAGESVQAALDRATPGSVVTLAAAVFRERVIVDRPLTLAGQPGAVLSGSGVGTVLTIAADDVRVADLRVTGSGDHGYEDDAGVVVSGQHFELQRLEVQATYTGIDLRRAHHGVVEGCVVRGDRTRPFGLRGDGIRLWESDHNRVQDNRLESVRDLVVWYSEHNTLADNVVTDSRYGTHLMHASGNHIERNSYDRDVVGVFVMYSADVRIAGNRVIEARGEAGVGLGFKESDRIEVLDNVLVGNTTGIYLDTTPHAQHGAALFRGNLIGANEVGVRLHGPSQGARFEDNTFLSNGLPLEVDGRADTAAITFDGNAWSDYAGYDLDGDGTGDLPYEARSVTGRLTERRPSLAYFTGTPAAALLELLARAFPMFAPPPLAVDPHPRSTP
jgi:nitrous oxidase accessory protein